MKKIITSLLFFSTISLVNAQSFAYRGGNYTGVYGVFSNPANIASSPRKWDVNLLSVSALGANNKVEIGFGNLNKDLKEEFLDGENKELSGFVNVEIVGPSFMMNINPKNAIAVTTRARLFGNIGTLNTKFAQSIEDVKNINLSTFPYQLNAGNQRIALNAWSEIGASWASVIFKKANHSIKVGATVKYLRGIGNSFANINNLSATIALDNPQGNTVKPYLTDGSGEFVLANSGVDLFDDNLESSDFTGENGSGVGFDLGVVYEYRDESDSINWCKNCHNHGYKLKVAASLTDVGSIKYNTIKGSSFYYTLNIPAGQKFYLEELSGSVDDIEKYFDESPYAQKGKELNKYKPALPAALNLMVDYHWGRHFFTEFAARLSLVDDNKPENAYYYNGFTLTPRLENKYFGVCFPLNYNEITDFNAGLTLRMGPLMVGSGSVISSLFTDSKQADVFVGIRFGL